MQFKAMYFKFQDHQLCLASDPDEEALGKMVDLLDTPIPPNQSEFQNLVKKNLCIGQKDFRKLLKKGEKRNLWYSKHTLSGNKIEYFRTEKG